MVSSSSLYQMMEADFRSKKKRIKYYLEKAALGNFFVEKAAAPCFFSIFPFTADVEKLFDLSTAIFFGGFSTAVFSFLHRVCGKISAWN